MPFLSFVAAPTWLGSTVARAVRWDLWPSKGCHLRGGASSGCLLR